MELDSGFESIGGRPAGITEEARHELNLLHGLRVGLIQEFFLNGRSRSAFQLSSFDDHRRSDGGTAAPQCYAVDEGT